MIARQAALDRDAFAHIRVEHVPTSDVRSSRLIKRYGNRKLYDVAASQYITLEGIEELVRAGEDVEVIDNDTGENLTAVTFAQIIYEGEKRKNHGASLPLLRSLIQRGDEAVRDLLRGVERGREAFDSVREATERRVHQLVGQRGKKGRGLLEELLDAPQRQIDQLQKRIDSQVRESVQRVTKHPAFQREIQRLEQSIKRLERGLGQLRAASRSRPGARSRKRTGKRR
jgi:polyhydroxyalkanoate synthesis repressor PhaR